jgi:hypothetical protein
MEHFDQPSLPVRLIMCLRARSSFFRRHQGMIAFALGTMVGALAVALPVAALILAS